jgi:hypothetical protein
MAATGNRTEVEMLGIRYGERTNTMDDERHQGGGAHVCLVASTSLLRPLAQAPFATKLHSATARARERVGEVHLSTQCLRTPLGRVERYVPPPGSSRHRDAICNKNRTWGGRVRHRSSCQNLCTSVRHQEHQELATSNRGTHNQAQSPILSDLSTCLASIRRGCKDCTAKIICVSDSRPSRPAQNLITSRRALFCTAICGNVPQDPQPIFQSACMATQQSEVGHSKAGSGVAAKLSLPHLFFMSKMRMTQRRPRARPRCRSKRTCRLAPTL